MNDGPRLTGFAELHAALGELGKSTERGVLRRIAVKALTPVVDRARDLAPVDEGDLRDSIVIGTKLTRRAKAAAKADPVDGVRVFAGTANRNGVAREFGSSRSRPQPFMRPAWEAEKGSALRIVSDDLRDEIVKTAARAAKRQKKGP